MPVRNQTRAPRHSVVLRVSSRLAAFIVLVAILYLAASAFAHAPGCQVQRTLAYGSADVERTRGRQIPPPVVKCEADYFAAEQMCFSPDSKLLATAGDGGTVRLFDIPSGKEAGRLENGNGDVHRLIFFKDGKTVAVGFVERGFRGKDLIFFWDVATKKQVRKIDFDVGSRWVLAEEDKTLVHGLHATDLDTGRRRKLLDVPRGNILQFAYEPRSNILAAAWDYEGTRVRFCNVKSGEELSEWGPLTRVSRSEEGPLRFLAFSPDGKHLAHGGMNRWQSNATEKDEAAYRVRLYNMTQQREAVTLQNNKLAVKQLAFTPDGNYLFARCHNSPEHRLWDVKSGQELPPFVFPHDGKPFAFSPDGKWLAIGPPTRRGWEISLYDWPNLLESKR